LHVNEIACEAPSLARFVKFTSMLDGTLHRFGRELFEESPQMLT
jgi:hypothetical protein